MDRNRALTAVVLGLMVAALVAFWGFRPAVGPQVTSSPVAGAPTVLGPAATQRGRTTWQRRAAWVHRHPLASPETRGVAVLLTSPWVRPHALERRPELQPVHFFPDASEAPLPRGEPTRLLEVLLQAEAQGEGVAQAEQAFLDAARAARLDPTSMDLVEDPWRALLTLETERRRALKKSANEAEKAAKGRWLDRLAAALVEGHPDSPIADYAWLYRLEVLGDPAWDTFDAGRAGRQGAMALRSSSDALVRAVALSRIAGAAGHANDLLADLDAAWAAARPTPWLAAAGADHAVAVGEASGVERWLERLADTVELMCDETVGGTCRAWRLETEWARAQRRAILGDDGETWRDHATIAAWRCHVWRERLEEASLTGAATFDGLDWRWRRWDAAGDVGMFPGCVEAEVFFGPHPDGEAELRIQVQTYGKPPSHLTP